MFLGTKGRQKGDKCGKGVDKRWTKGGQGLPKGGQERGVF